MNFVSLIQTIKLATGMKAVHSIIADF